LVHQLIIKRASGLIAFQRIMPVCGLIEAVPTDQHGARLLGLVEAKQEVGEAQDRTSSLVAPTTNGLRKRVIGAVRERVSVNDQQRASLCHRFRNHSTKLRRRLISREVAIGMYSRKFSRSITRSPGSRPSPSFAITGQSTPTATSTSPKIIRSRLIGDAPAAALLP
jgi:hypothetical protein